MYQSEELAAVLELTLANYENVNKQYLRMYGKYGIIWRDEFCKTLNMILFSSPEDNLDSIIKNYTNISNVIVLIILIVDKYCYF